MRIIPDSLAGRVVLMLVVILTVSHFASMAIYYGDRVTTLTLLGGGHFAERVATVARIVERFTPVERPRVIAALESPTTRASLSRAPVRWVGGGGDWRTSVFRSVLLDHLGTKDDSTIRVGYAVPRREYGSSHEPSPLLTSFQDADGPVMGVSVQFADSSWVNFAAPVTGAAPRLSFRVVLSSLVMGVAIVVAAFWAARRLTAPLAMLAEAAQRLGRNVHAPPLIEGGPFEVRMAAAALNEMQRRIERFVRDRTLMIAAISHDLGTPITRLRLRAEFVEDEEEKHKILGDLEEMDQMISSVIAFARDESSEEPIQKIDLAATLSRICDEMADSNKAASFEGENRVPFHCRPIAVRRALRNVIENAVKYGGRARVSLRRDEAGVIVRVDDDGPGLPEDALEKVFEPFYRLDGSRSRESGGTGLGLTVARTVVGALGGSIRLTNRGEGGLRVEITFPR